MADAPFNSSDLEFSEQEDSGARLGRRAKACIVANSLTDRIESKKTVKTLKDRANAPSTNYHRQYWFELFKQYAVVTLGINDRANKTPTAEDVIRFFDRLPNHLQSRHSDGKIAWTLVKNALVQLDRSLTFHYADYNLSRHGRLRIEATIQKLLDDGQITQDPVREKQWLTCQIVKKLAAAVVSDAVQNGTRSWDVTVAGTFSLVLQAALASRSGDFKRSAHYTGDEYLKWQDIELVAVGSNDNDKLVFKMLVKLFYRKGFKRNKSKAVSIELGELVDDDDSIVDPVKLCIAYALRVGAVKETSWSDLLDAVRARPSKRIVWAKPSSPVFYALTRSEQLNMSAPAPVDQQRRFLCRAAELVGMLNVPVAHDLRRGAAADIYSLKPDTPSGATDRVRRALGHSIGAMENGTTDEYIGREKGDSWAARLGQTSNSTTPAPLGVAMATAPFKKQKLMTKDIDNYCDTNGLSKDRNGRYAARRALLQAQHQQWAEHQRSILDGLQPTTPTAKPQPQWHATGSITTGPVRLPLQDVTNVSRTTSGFGAQTQRVLEHEDVSDNNDDDDEIANTDTGTSSVLGNLNPALLTFADDLLGIGSSARDAAPTLQGDSAVSSMAEGCVFLWAKSLSQANDEVAVLTAPRDQFIGYLSSVNLVSLSETTLEKRATGNSRDPPSRFIFYCQTEECPRTFFTALRRDQHQVNCGKRLPPLGPHDLEDVQDDTFDPSPAPKAMKAKRKRKGSAPQDLEDVQDDTFDPSPAPEAKKAKRNRTKEEIDKAKEEFPEPCPDSAICGVTKDFANENLLRNHRALHHDPNWPEGGTPCNFPGCQLPREHLFISREQFRRHLASRHMLTAEQANVYVGKIIPVEYKAPRGISKIFVPTKCLFPNCRSGQYTNYSDYTMHLKKAHRLTVEQYPKYMPAMDALQRRPAA